MIVLKMIYQLLKRYIRPLMDPQDPIIAPMTPYDPNSQQSLCEAHYNINVKKQTWSIFPALKSPK